MIHRLKKYAIGFIVPLLVILIWVGNSKYEWKKSVFLPPLSRIPESFIDMVQNQDFFDDFNLSLRLVAQGFFAGAGIGFVVGLAAAISKRFDEIFGPSINALRQVPSLAWFPLIMLMAGIGSSSKTIIIAFAVFFPIFMNTYQSIRLVPQEYIEVGNIFAFSRVRLLWKVIIPSALPGIFVGVRYSAGLSWAMIVGADMLGGTKGLGYLLMRAQDLLMIDQLFVVIFVIGFVGFIIDTALAYLQRWLLAWKRESVR